MDFGRFLFLTNPQNSFWLGDNQRPSYPMYAKPILKYSPLLLNKTAFLNNLLWMLSGPWQWQKLKIKISVSHIHVWHNHQLFTKASPFFQCYLQIQIWVLQFFCEEIKTEQIIKCSKGSSPWNSGLKIFTKGSGTDFLKDDLLIGRNSWVYPQYVCGHQLGHGVEARK